VMVMAASLSEWATHYTKSASISTRQIVSTCVAVPASIACFVIFSFKVLVVCALTCGLIGCIWWFITTNLSVEITVWLARFFPPAKQTVCNGREFKWTKLFRDNHEAIYKEYLQFEKTINHCPQMDDVFPNGAITNWDRKWPTVTLRCYGLDSHASKFFPHTMKIVNTADVYVSHVMFSILDANKFIPRHRGPYRGVFRYQLALEVPPAAGIDKLYLAVWPGTSSQEFWPPEYVPPEPPVVLTWKVGQDFLFDDTCVHEVRNNTVCRRIILFMDVERHDVPFFSRLLHKFFMAVAPFLPAVKEAIGVQDVFMKSHKCSNGTIRSDEREQVHDDQDYTVNKSSSIPDLMPFKDLQTGVEPEFDDERI